MRCSSIVKKIEMGGRTLFITRRPVRAAPPRRLWAPAIAPLVSVGLPGRLDGRGCHGQGVARLQRGMRDAPDMPELQKNTPPVRVHGLCHLAPAFYLREAMDPWGVGIAH